MPGKQSKRLRNIKKAKEKQAAKQASRKEKLATMNATAIPEPRPTHMSIPIVTEEDLLDFQIAHFGDDTRPENWFIGPNDEESGILCAQGHQVEADSGQDLGTYDDGTKRMLTDAEIAIFRNTERQEHYRALRLAREEADNEETKSDAGAGTEQMVQADDRPRKRNKHNNRRNKQSAGAQHTLPRKSSYADFVDDRPDAGGATFRRQARELDEQMAVEIEMDY